MPQQNTKDPNYYHKVVDCQWACPAHTNVPEYIRMIAEERFADAYLLNRSSNVFPGILGRVCDRPCEPACRRGRVEDKPVAICRLKRVAADYKGDIRERLPKAPLKANGKKVALIGAGPASLTVANDLAPLGYQCTIFEKGAKAGGAMHASVPSFRLPESVLMEEIGYILDLGVELKLNAPVNSMKALLSEGYDAVFVGTGAPKGRDLDLPGRKEAGASIQVGLDWLAQVAFDHAAPIGKRVIVIGGGNTAMDCSRTARRLGGREVMVIAPEEYNQMLASPWEKEDAGEEGIIFRNKLLPEHFVVDGHTLKGVSFKPLKQAYDANGRFLPVPSGEPPVVIPCDTVILAIGQNTAYPFIEMDSGITMKSGQPMVDEKTFQSSLANVFFGGDAAFGPKNIIWAVAQGHEAAISIDLFLKGRDLKADRPPVGMNLVSQKMGIHEWSYGNDYSEQKRVAVPHVAVVERFDQPKKEVELGFGLAEAIKEAKRCLNCDVQTVFQEKSCIECDACIDICPIDCLTLTSVQGSTTDELTLTAPRLNKDQHLFISEPLIQTSRVMVKDENLCLHCGLCAERCPTGAWDMQKFTLLSPRPGV